MFTLGIDIEARCNFFATIWFLLIGKVAIDFLYLDVYTQPFAESILQNWEINHLDFKNWWKEIPYPSLVDPRLLIRNVIWLTYVIFTFEFMVLDAVVYYLMISHRISIHSDNFSFFIVVGKVALLACFVYLTGLINYENHLEILLRSLMSYQLKWEQSGSAS